MKSWLAAAALLLAPAVLADGLGEKLFREHCAPCHGLHGEGGRGAKLAVRKLPRAPDDATLGSIIAQGIPGTEMPVTRMTDPERAELIAYVRSLGQEQQAASSPVSGDRTRGEQLFWAKGNCGNCHTVGPRGGRIGPDLTNIGERRGPANLRQSILEPEAETPDNFAQYRKVIYMPDNYLRVRVVTADGKQIAGARVDEDTFTIQIRDDASRIYSFRKDQLKELHEDWGKSPMPSYRSIFMEPELNDVIAYLSSLTGAP